MITSKVTDKQIFILTINSLAVVMTMFLVIPHVFAAETGRTAEQMLGTTRKQQENTIPPSVHSEVSSPKGYSSEVAKSRPARKANSQGTVSGLKIEIPTCKYVSEYKSVTCDMKLTNQEHDMETVLHCYTGTVAQDEKGNTLQCAHVWLGSNHSWNFAHDKILRGKPVKGMIRLETRTVPVKLKRLEISFTLNNTVQTMILKNIPVVH